jgi:hypothetical protein
MKKTTLCSIIACLALLVLTARDPGSSFGAGDAGTTNSRNTTIFSGDPVLPPLPPPPPPINEHTPALFMA